MEDTVEPFCESKIYINLRKHMPLVILTHNPNRLGVAAVPCQLPLPDSMYCDCTISTTGTGWTCSFINTSLLVFVKTFAMRIRESSFYFGWVWLCCNLERPALRLVMLWLGMLIPGYLDTRVPCGLPGSWPGSRETSDLPSYRDCLHQSTDCLCGHIQASTALAAAENAERPVC